ncbi:hypothetical protein SH2C18_19450 [Clostridium sediminicola]|uniref:NADase-type glycan-binding domain-containing protein n=1 Tax=Clostridium sediminicola TaxID=3114879 RepID=UPI0031F25B66
MNMNKRLITMLVCIGLIAITVMTTGCGKTHEQAIKINSSSIEANDNISDKKSDISIEEPEVSDIVEIDKITFTVEASSTLQETVSGKTNVHSIINISNSDMSTAWVEGTKGDGIGEWISFNSNEKFNLDSLQLANGYSKSESSYNKNNRVAEIEIISSKGDKRYFNFDDNTLTMQNCDVNFHDITGVKIVITKIYKGTKYNDLCISELNFNNQSLNLVLTKDNAEPTEFKADNTQPVNNKSSFAGSYCLDNDGGGFFDENFHLIEKYDYMKDQVQCSYNFALLETGKVSMNEGADSYYAGKWSVKDGNVIIIWDNGSSEKYISKNGMLFKKFIIGNHPYYNFNSNSDDMVYDGFAKEILSEFDYPPKTQY